MQIVLGAVIGAFITMLALWLSTRQEMKRFERIISGKDERP